jgi:DNA-binding GntR family transcriptional regulator
MAISNDTLSQRVHEELRRRILNAELARGGRVNVEQLAEDFQVSPSPVKDALRQLAREGLVEIRPRSGTVVRDFDEKDVADIYRCRELIEPAAAAIVAAKGPIPTDLRQRLEATIRTLQDASVGKQFVRPLDVSDADGTFHRLIVKASDNAVLSELHELLIARALVVRSYASGSSRAVETIEEHRAILDALTAGDADAAAETSRRHLRHAEAFILDSMGAGSGLEPSTRGRKS